MAEEKVGHKEQQNWRHRKLSALIKTNLVQLLLFAFAVQKADTFGLLFCLKT